MLFTFSVFNEDFQHSHGGFITINTDTVKRIHFVPLATENVFSVKVIEVDGTSVSFDTLKAQVDKFKSTVWDSH